MNNHDMTTDQLLTEVTALRRRMAKLKKSKAQGKQVEEHYLDLIMNEKDIIYTLDDKGLITFSNRAVEKILGYKPEDLVGRHFTSLIPQSLREKTVADFNILLRTGEIVAETVLMDIDGWLHNVEYSSTTIKENGKIVGSRGIIRDITSRKQAEEELQRYRQHLEQLIEEGTAELRNINDQLRQELTERKQIEEALRASEARFRTLFEAIPEAVMVHDDDGTILHINDVGARRLELPVEDLVGKNIREIITPENITTISDHVREAHVGGSCRFETTYVSRTGRNIIAEVNERPIEYGKKKAILSVSRDITERKRTEEALRESEERFRKLFEQSNDAIIIHQSGRIVDVNHKTCEMLGYHKDQLVQMNIADLFPAEERPISSKSANTVKKDRSMQFETQLLKADGTLIDVEVSSSVIDHAKNIIQGIGRDITERKKAERERQRSFKQLQKALEGTVNALVSLAEKRDPYTAGHQQRVTMLACAIAGEMNLSEEQIHGIRMAATVHDIGKISVPAEILNKPGQLTELQSNIMRTHPQVGYDILKEVEFPWPVAQIVLQHHERINGSGYPHGISCEKIMLESRILTVADVVEAMVSHRPYREAYSVKRALEEILQHKGILYDSEVVDVCSKIIADKEFTFT